MLHMAWTRNAVWLPELVPPAEWVELHIAGVVFRSLVVRYGSPSPVSHPCSMGLESVQMIWCRL